MLDTGPATQSPNAASYVRTSPSSGGTVVKSTSLRLSSESEPNVLSTALPPAVAPSPIYSFFVSVV